MADKNLYARELNKHYYQATQALINTYCQIKNHDQLQSLPKLSRTIKQYQGLTNIWGTIAELLDGAEEK